ncbi:MAG: exo-alpha-sialidase [Proteiniphilum sp.]|uniref:exo-alpha-sialidase n=1 Tax=Proteiniphilum sp. TaxID=1926877 RepID=UPI000A8A6142|nr:exo-alpha-sialidase [Proteiniphilum sp.]MEA5127928.1 exo-alpha-sialidase [Proteiniphilum sp.]
MKKIDIAKYLVVALFCFCNMNNLLFAQKDNKVTIIFDTDMGPDYDDVGALALLHALADKGEVNILATVSSNMYENAVPCIDVLNHYFGRPDIPVGGPTEGVNVVDGRFVDKLYWCEILPALYPHRIKSSDKYPDAVELYRKMLSKQPDNSVTIVTVGFFTNLAMLLETQGDSYSELDGKELIRKKVKHLVSMAGSFPEGREFNVYRDSISSVKVFNDWPTPVILSGFQIGVDIRTGLRLVANEKISGSPVKDAYSLCIPTDKKGRSSWDQTAVLVAVKGFDKYFDIKYGTMTVLPNGNNTWQDKAAGQHGQLIPKIPKEDLAVLIEDLMMHQPVKSSRISTVPTIDISGQKKKHIIIATGTETIYQGHPTTVLMEDGRTIFCVWSFNHGGVAGPMAKSTDGGLTWEQVESPADWKDMKNCPSIYRMIDKKGKERLMVYSAQPNIAQSYSEDGGKTWSPVRSMNMTCVMAFTSMVRLKNGDYLAMYNRRPQGQVGPPQNEVCQSISKDGGLTWERPRVVVVNGENNIPCEPFVFYSPDKKQLACLIRDNKRDGHSLVIFSDDEGETWSDPIETPWGLTGDRHIAQYAPDGRLVVAFRDMAPLSPTRGHFIIWVGHYNDLVCQTLGQYRVKLLHSYAGNDCGYPGLEILPDGTFLATTYIKYKAGEKKHSIVSLRFTLDEMDSSIKSSVDNKRANK